MSKGGWWTRALLVAAPLLALALSACGGGEKEASTPTAAAKGTGAAGATAAAPAPAVKEAKLELRVDTVWGSKNMAEADKPAKACVQTTRVKPGEQIGWRMKIFDSASGKALDDKEIASAQLKLGDGQVFEVKYGPHGGQPPRDAFWAYFWVVPDTQPTGVLPWTMTVKAKDGRTAELKHSDTFNIPTSWLTILAK